MEIEMEMEMEMEMETKMSLTGEDIIWCYLPQGRNLPYPSW
jgi:hypothetical protein